MVNYDRRNLIERFAQTSLYVALLKSGLAVSAFSGAAAQEIDDWAKTVDETCRDLRVQKLSDAGWRSALSDLFSRVELTAILQTIDFERLSAGLEFAEKGVSTADITLPGFETRQLAFFPRLFAMGEGRAIIPHGHENMVSAHLVLSGTFHTRQFDKIAVEEDALVIRPTIDQIDRAGTVSSIAQEKDNVHWLIAEGGPAYTFDMIVGRLDPHAEKSFDIYNIDPLAGEPLDGDLIRAPRLNVEEALAKYG